MVVILGVTGCSAMSNDVTSLKQKGLDIAVMMDYLAENKDYAELFSSSDDINKIITSIGKEDYSNPRVVFEIKGLEEAMLNLISGDLTLSQELKDIMGNKFSTAFGGQINAINGVEHLAATSILNYSDSFIFNDVTEPITYLYLYDGDYSVIVNFNPFYEDDVVSASGTVILNNSFIEAIETQDITNILKEFGVDGVTITLIE